MEGKLYARTKKKVALTGDAPAGSMFRIPTYLHGTEARAQAKTKELADQSLEDLMNIEVTSVAKKSQRISQTAAAITVVTEEDIRRSGALSLPDILRRVPGVNVAQINANMWAISVRGFNGEFSNKLLVMIDGRSVYQPTFSGVFWDV